MIQQHNLEADRGLHTYRLGTNHLADMVSNRERERERETDRQTDIQTDRQTLRLTDRDRSEIATQ